MMEKIRKIFDRVRRKIMGLEYPENPEKCQKKIEIEYEYIAEDVLIYTRWCRNCPAMCTGRYAGLITESRI